MLPDVLEVRLDNGFVALLVERRTLPVVASTIWYRVGSRDERTGETGLSHFLEHMMFKGTDRFAKGEIDLLTSKMGGANNAFTDHDVTAYYFSLASDRWETALEIERSRMRGCLLDPREFESEKSVVLEELAMGEDDPWRSLYQATESLLFQVHPYHHPIIGWRGDLERLQPAGMRAFYDRHYGPNRAFLVAVGDFDRQAVAERVRGLFGDLPPTAAARGEVLAEPPPRGERRSRWQTPYAVARLAIAFSTCRMGERDDYVLDVLAHALGANKSSRLHRRLVLEEALATEVNALNETRLDPGAFWVLVELRQGADVERVESIVREEVAELARTGVPAAELRRIREQIRAAFAFEEETVLDLALKLGRFEALAAGGYRDLAEVLPTYAAIDNKEIKAVARRYLDFSRAAVVQAMPRAKAVTAAGKPARGKKAGKKKAGKKKAGKKAAKKKVRKKAARAPRRARR